MNNLLKPTVCLLALAAWPIIALSQSPPAPMTRPATVDLSTPQKAATAMFRALSEEDGKTFLASVDTTDEKVRVVLSARAASMDAGTRYRTAVKEKFGITDDRQAFSGNTAMFKALMTGVEQATAEIKGEEATLVPVAPAAAGAAAPSPDDQAMMTMFALRLVRAEGAWRVKLQDSGMGLKVDVSPQALLQAEQLSARAAVHLEIAAEITAGKYKTVIEADAALSTRAAEADRKVIAKWRASQAPATSRP